MKEYFNKIESETTFRIKTGYYLELLTPKTLKLLESTKKNMSKNIGNNINKKLGGKYSQKLLKTASNRVIKKTAEVPGNLICNKISNKIRIESLNRKVEEKLNI